MVGQTSRHIRVTLDAEEWAWVDEVSAISEDSVGYTASVMLRAWIAGRKRPSQQARPDQWREEASRADLTGVQR